MEENASDVRWSPRVPKSKVRRLYESACQGVWDDELIDDVGMTLYLRCRDIVNIYRAKAEGKVTCPRCQRAGTATLITRHGNRQTPMECPVCGWTMTWLDYRSTFRRHQLNPGGAVRYLVDFMRSYEQARTPKDKLLAIDRVIHEFHYSFRDLPDQSTRAVCVNLIDGTLTEVLAFLDELSAMELPGTMRDTYTVWRAQQNSIDWGDTKERRQGGK